MQLKSVLLALGLGIGAAPLSAQIVRRDPSTRRPTQTGTVGDIIFGSSRADSICRVRDAVTPDGRVVQVCDDRRNRREGDDDQGERGARGTQHVNDRDGDGDFDARDRSIRKRQHEIAKAQRKADKSRLKAFRKSRGG